MGSTGAGFWGQPVCTDPDGSAAASYFSLAWPGCRFSMGRCTKSIWSSQALVSSTNVIHSSELCQPPALQHCQLLMEVCKTLMLNPSAADASTESSSPHVGLRNPPVKLSVIAGNYSKYSGSIVSNMPSTQDAPKSWQI